MAVYVVGQITIKDEQKWERYKARVPQSLEGYDASILLRGSKESTLEQAIAYEHIVVLQFPSLQAAKSWHTSNAYQELIPLRKEAATVSLSIYIS